MRLTYPTTYLCSNMYRTVFESVDLLKDVPIASAIGQGREHIRILSKIVECWIAPDKIKHAVSVRTYIVHIITMICNNYVSY